MLGDKIGEVFSQKEESNVSTREINETKKTISDIFLEIRFIQDFLSSR